MIRMHSRSTPGDLVAHFQDHVLLGNQLGCHLTEAWPKIGIDHALILDHCGRLQLHVRMLFEPRVSQLVERQRVQASPALRQFLTPRILSLSDAGDGIERQLARFGELDGWKLTQREATLSPAIGIKDSPCLHAARRHAQHKAFRFAVAVL